MNILKFRAWDIANEEMIDVGCIDFYLNKTKVYDKNQPFFSMYLDDVRLMQYTGLKDMDGCEIYEGDIVQYNDGEFSFTGFVQHSAFGWYVVGNDDNYSFEDFADEIAGIADVKVIGNVYQGVLKCL